MLTFDAVKRKRYEKTPSPPQQATPPYATFSHK
nr:MAG TPA: hypothetical protein [Caudoviricetes sp.]